MTFLKLQNLQTNKISEFIIVLNFSVKDEQIETDIATKHYGAFSIYLI